MLFTIFATFSLLTGLSVAQSSSSNGTTFDINQVPLSLRNQWCTAETNNCPTLCGGPTFITSNNCNGADLTYQCKCTNGTSPPNIAAYLDTLPNNICQATFQQCNKANPGSSSCQTCGKLNVKDIAPSSTTMSASATASATSSGSASASASSDKKGNAGVRIGAGMGSSESAVVMAAWAVLGLGAGIGAVAL